MAALNQIKMKENLASDKNNLCTNDLVSSLDQDCDNGKWERIGRFKIQKNKFQIGRFSVSIKHKKPCSMIGRFICNIIDADIDTDDCDNDFDIDTNINSTDCQKTMETNIDTTNKEHNKQKMNNQESVECDEEYEHQARPTFICRVLCCKMNLFQQLTSYDNK